MCGIKQRMIVFLSSYQESGIRAGLFTRESIERNIGPIYDSTPYYKRPLPKIMNHELEDLRSIMDRKAAKSAKEEKKRQEETCPECYGYKFPLLKKCFSCEDKEKKRQEEICPECSGYKSFWNKKCSFCENKEKESSVLIDGFIYKGQSLIEIFLKNQEKGGKRNER